METRLRVTVAISALVLIAYTVELIRRGKLREEYSLLWLGMGALMLVLTAVNNLVDTVARVLGVAYPPSALFMIALFGALLGFLHVSVVMSRQSEHIKILAQEIAILKHELSSSKASQQVVVPEEE
jgi:hypothetical protein